MPREDAAGRRRGSSRYGTQTPAGMPCENSDSKDPALLYLYSSYHYLGTLIIRPGSPSAEV